MDFYVEKENQSEFRVHEASGCGPFAPDANVR